MYYLFLDTETSGLTPNNGEIIEIAAVIAKFDTQKLCFQPVDSFQSLAMPQMSIDAKIERLTGITNQDLSLAKKKSQVKEEWSQWLDKIEDTLPKIEGIIGHSINFDEVFLKAEGWYLPDVKFIDTLDWAKILLPEFYAINLEYIQDKIGFNVEDLGLNKNTLNNLSVHRALYDTYLCVHVANFMLQQFVSLPISTNFAKEFQKNYLHLNFNFYPAQSLNQSLNSSTSTVKGDDESVQINGVGNLEQFGPLQTENANLEEVRLETKDRKFVTPNGKLSAPSFTNLIDQISSNKISYLEELCSINQGKALNFLLHQIYIIILKKYSSIGGKSNKFKIHTFGEGSYYLIHLVLQSLAENDNETQNYVWQNPEKMLNSTKQIVYESFEFGKAAELAIILSENLNDESYTGMLKKLNSYHDFLLFHLQNLFQNYEYWFYPDSSDLAALNIKSQLKQIYSLIEQLKTRVLDIDNAVIKAINDEFQDQIRRILLASNQVFRIHNQNGLLTILKKKTNFNLQDFVANILKHYNLQSIDTDLDTETWNKFVNILNLTSILENVEVNYTIKNEISFYPQKHLEDILNTAYQESVETGKPCFVLGGQNSSMKDCQKITAEYFKNNQYLVLGESGSLTKISSKIMAGFKGLVIGKVSNLHYFSTLQNLAIASIYVINEPYMYIEDGFISKEMRLNLLSEFKAIYLQSLANYTGRSMGVKFTFVRSYGSY